MIFSLFSFASWVLEGALSRHLCPLHVKSSCAWLLSDVFWQKAWICASEESFLRLKQTDSVAWHCENQVHSTNACGHGFQAMARFVTGAPTNASQVLLMAQCHLPRSIDLDNRGVMWTFVPIQSLHSSWPRPCSLPQLSPGDCDPHYTTLLSGHRGRPPSSELQ